LHNFNIATNLTLLLHQLFTLQDEILKMMIISHFSVNVATSQTLQKTFSYSSPKQFNTLDSFSRRLWTIINNNRA